MDNPPDFMAQWDYQDPAATALRFRRLLEEAQDDLQYELELLTQIARTHSLQRQFAQAHQLLDEIEPRLTDATPRARLRALLERGRTFNSAGDTVDRYADQLAAHVDERVDGWAGDLLSGAIDRGGDVVELAADVTGQVTETLADGAGWVAQGVTNFVGGLFGR